MHWTAREKFSADGSTVSLYRSFADIAKALESISAVDVAFVPADVDGDGAVLFTHDGTDYRLEVPLLGRAEVVTRGPLPRGWAGLLEEHREAWLRRRVGEEERRRWRTLALLVRARCQAVRDEITTFEREFR